MTTAFEYKLDILKKEIDHVQEAIRQMDDISKSIKNWTILVWGVGLGTAIATQSLNNYVWLTAVFPLLFWFIDGVFHRVQRRLIHRFQLISEFLNNEKFVQLFNQQTFGAFFLLDPIARKCQGEEYERFVSLKNVLRMPILCVFYIGLALISLLVHLIVAQASP